MIPTYALIVEFDQRLASCKLEDMCEARVDGQVQWFQLYVNSDRAVTIDLIKRAEKGGVKALVITVDAPSLGKREKDMRLKFEDSGPDKSNTTTNSTRIGIFFVLRLTEVDVDSSQGASRHLSHFIDPALEWNDLAWIKSATKLPIILKGIQCGQDAILAVKYGAQGIVVSNHGGRQVCKYSHFHARLILLEHA